MLLGLNWNTFGNILGQYWVHIDFQFRAILEDIIITYNTGTLFTGIYNLDTL